MTQRSTLRLAAMALLTVLVAATCSKSKKTGTTDIDSGLAHSGSDAARSPDGAQSIDATSAVDAASTLDTGTAPIDTGMCSTSLDTDDANCGTCGHSCLGQGCAAGICMPHTLDPNGDAFSVTVAAGYVYVVRPDASPPSAYMIVRTSTDSGAETVLYSTPVGHFPGGITADATNVYWGESEGATYRVLQLPHGADASTPPTLAFTPGTYPGRLTLQGGTFYWQSSLLGLMGRPWKRVGATGTDVPLTTADIDAGVQSLAVTSDGLFWSDTTGQLRQVPIATGTASVVAGATLDTSATSGSRLVGVGDYVYFAVHGQSDPSHDGVFRVRLGATVESLHTEEGVDVAFCGADGTVYYMGRPPPAETRSIFRLDAGGAAHAIAIAGSAATEFAGENTLYLFLISAPVSGGPILRVVK